MAGVERDTRACHLEAQARLNYYPASPLASISWIFTGHLHLLENADSSSSAPILGPALPRLIFSGPQRRPTASWSPGPVHALMVGIYPEALAQLLGHSVAPWLDRTVPLADIASPALLAACESVLADPSQAFSRLENELQSLCASTAPASPLRYLGDWVRQVATRATHSSAGLSLRQWQRRIHDWTGQSQRDLQLFARMEAAFMQQLSAGNETHLAHIAADAGFADQSHMGREIKRITGMSPGKFSQRLAKDESFWYYRLLAEKLQNPA